MLNRTNAGNSSTVVNGLRRRVRLGVSLTGLMLAGTALAPAMAADIDVGAGLIVTTGSADNYFTDTGGTLTADTVGGGFTLSGNLTNGAATLSLSKISAGTLILSGTNTYTGGSTIFGGTVQLDSANALGTGVITLSGGTLALNTANALSDTTNGIVINASGSTIQSLVAVTTGKSLAVGANPFTINTSGDNLTLSGAITGSGALSKTGIHLLTVSGNNAGYTGAVTVNAGALRLNGASGIGTGLITLNGGNLHVGNASALSDTTNGIAVTASSTLKTFAAYSSAKTVNIAGGSTLSVDTNNLATTLSGNFTGAGGLTKIGAGALTLSGANNSGLTGLVTLNAGTVTIANSNSLGSGAGGIDVTGASTISVTGASAITLTHAIASANSSSLTVNPGTGGITLSGAITGNLRLSKSGANNLTVSGASNTYSGGTGLAAGTLTVTNSGGLGSGTLTLTGDGALTTAAGAVVLNNVVALGGNTLTVTPGAGGLTLGGNIANGAIVKNGANVLTLSGASNTFAGGITLNAGTLRVGNATALGGGTVTVAGASTLATTGAVVLGNAFQVDAALTANTAGGDITIGGGGLAGAGSITKSGANNLNIVGNNAGFAGTTTVSGGTLVLAPASTVGGDIAIGLNATLGGTGTASGNVSVAGVLAPGNSPGTIAVLGNLNLLGGSSLSYELGTPGVVGGATNDLTTVGGNLTIGTAVNLTITPAATFTTGVYTLFTFGGTLFANPANSLNAPVVVGTPAGFTYTYGYGTVPGAVTLNVGYNGTYFWDGPAVTANVTEGGMGTWNTTTTNFTNDAATGNAQIAWVDSATSNAVFGVTGNTVTNAGARTFGKLTFAADNYIVTGGSLAPGATGEIEVTGANTATIGSTFTGANALKKSGTGTLVLGADNTGYLGGFNLSQGTIDVRQSQTLGDSALTMANNTTLRAGVSGLTLANDIAITGTGFVTMPNGTLALNGVISGGRLSVAALGGGTLTLGGLLDNTYSGGTALTAGTLALNKTQALGTGALTMSNGTTLVGLSALSLSNAIAITGAGTIQTDADLTVTGRISGGALTKTGTSALILNGSLANTQTATTVNAGTVQVGRGDSLGAGLVTLGATTTLKAGASNLIVSNAMTIGAGAIVDVGAGNNFTLNGNIGGAGGSLSKTGSGTLILSGDSPNSYTAGVTLQDGTIEVRKATALGTVAGSLTMSDGTVLKSGIANLTIANGIVTNGIDTIDTNGNVFTLTGVISNTGSLTKVGAGTLVLGGAAPNTYQGGTTLTTGTIRVAKADALGAAAGGLTMADGTILQSGAANLTVANAVGITGTGTVDTNGNTLTLSGVVDGGTLAKIGAGTLVLNGAAPNTYGATTLTTGTIDLGKVGALGSGTVSMASGTTLAAKTDLTGANQVTNAIAITGTGTIDTTTNNIEIGGVISGGILNVTGGNGLNLSGVAANTQASTTLGGGTLQLSKAGALGAGALSVATGSTLLSGVSGLSFGNAITIAPAGTFIVDTSGNDMTLGGVISGVGSSLTKSGGGILTLSGASTYSGLTSVVNGTLNLNGSLAGDITLAVGSALTGSGGTTGTVTIGDGILAPGNSPAQVTYGSLVLAGGSTTNLELGEPNNAASMLNDKIIVTNALTLAGTLNVTLTGAAAVMPGGAGGYTLFTYGSLTDNGLTVSAIGGYTSQLQIGAGKVNLILLSAGSATQLYWDGADTAGNAGSLGGTGNWNTVATNSNWTLAPASTFNAYWVNGSEAIFQGTAGTATITEAGISAAKLTFDTTNYVVTSTGAGTLLADAPTVIDVAAAKATINATITGDSIEKQGTGTLVLGGAAANTYTNGTTLTAGTIEVAKANALGLDAGVVTMADGTTISLGSANATNAQTIGNDINILATGKFDVVTARTLTLTGQVSNGTLEKTGAGTLVLDGNNNYAATTLTTGTIRVTQINSLGNGTLAMANGTTLASGAGGLSIGNNIEIAALGTATVSTAAAGELDLTGIIYGATGTLAKTGAGTLILGRVAANTYGGGTTLSEGAIQAKKAGALGTGVLSMANLTTLLGDFGIATTVGNDIAITGTGQIDPNLAELTLSGKISGGVLNQIGAGTLILTNSGNGQSSTKIDTGTLALGNAGVLGAGSLTLGDNSAVEARSGNWSFANQIIIADGKLANINTNGNNLTLSGAISGVGSNLVKNTAGVLTLSGASTYTGATTVNDGTLNLNGSLTSDITLGAGTFLTGSGSTTGLVTVGDGTLAPGNSPAQVTYGSLALAAGSNLNFELGVPNNAASLLNDRIIVTNALTLAGTLNVTLTGGAAVAPGGSGIYTILTYGSVVDNILNVGAIAGYNSLIQVAGGKVNLILTAVGSTTQLYWDGADTAGNGASLGGNGNWTSAAANTNWSLSPGGNINASWIDGAEAIFDGTAGTATITSAGISASKLTFNTTNYVVTSTGAGTFAAAAPTVIDVAAAKATINATITGDSIDKQGTGTLVLGGAAANTYNNGTTLTAGTIEVAKAGALGGGLVTMADGTTISLGSANATNAQTIGNAIDITATGKFDVVAARTLTLSGLVSTGTLEKTGAGTLLLAGAVPNTYAGTTLTTGTIELGAVDALGGGALAMAGGTTLQVTALDLTVTNAITLGGTDTFNITNGRSVDLSGDISGVGGKLAKTGNGTLVLSGNNSYDGGTSIGSGGTIRVNSATALGDASGDVALANNATLQAGGAFAVANNIVITGTGKVESNGNIFTLNGVISGGILNQTQPGTLVLTNAGNSQSATNIDGGTLQVENNGVLGSGTLRLGNATAFVANLGSWSFANAIAIQTGSATSIDTNGNNLTLSGAISGAGGSFTKVGGGTLILAGSQANTYGGGTTLTDGTIQVNRGDALGANQLNMATGTTLASGAANLIVGNAIDLGVGTGTIDTSLGNNLTLSGSIGGAGGGILQKTGAGTLVLSGGNSYTGGTVINEGTVSIANNGNLGANAGAITFSGVSTLALTGNVTSTRDVALTFAGTIDTAALTTSTFSGVFTGTSLTKTGDGTLILSGANTYNGVTTLSAGTLGLGSSSTGAVTDGPLGTGALAMKNGTTVATVGGARTLGNAINIDAAATGTVNTAAGDLTLTGIIAGANSKLAKTGAGTLILDGAAANSYSGGTTLTQGTIQVNRGDSLGAVTGALTMADLTVLKSGVAVSVGNNIAIAAGGTGIIDTALANLTLSGTINGGVLNKIGANTLTLSSVAANSQSSTRVDGGTLVVANNGVLGSGQLSLANGTILQGSGATNLSFGNTVAITGGATIDTNGRSMTLTNAITDGTGAGSLVKDGAGTLILSGASTYSGTTTINTGTINLSTAGTTLATSTLTVENGASLTGIGTVTNAVVVNSGGILAPGNSPGTLTFGSLTLNGGAILNYDLGKANAIDPLNDRIIVTGNLDLAGASTLNVAQSTGGIFGPGFYNIIQAGSISGAGSVGVGTLANSMTGLIQTSATQVNLLVTATPTVALYWDSDATGNGTISGGTGNWNVTNSNWTGAAPSAINGQWVNGAVAFFQSTPGIVTINAGNISAQGLVFSVDGYTLASTGGNALDLAANTFISVAAGATTTASTLITGASALDKQGDGRLILSGANTYSGGTTLTTGTLAVAASSTPSTGAAITTGPLGTGSLTMAGGTTLQTIGSNAIGNAITLAATGAKTIDSNNSVFTVNGIVSGGGATAGLGLTKTGAGTLVLGGTGANTYTGGTALNVGTIEVAKANALGDASGALAMATGTTLKAGAAGLAVTNAIGITGTGTVDTNGVTFANNLFTLVGQITGDKLVKTGLGTLVLSNSTNTYAGGTDLNAGTIRVDVSSTGTPPVITAGPLGTGSLNMVNNTTLQAGVTGLTIGNAINIATNANAIVDTNGLANFTLSGVIGGTNASLTKVGGGTLTLTNASSSYTGGTYLNAGVIAVTVGSTDFSGAPQTGPLGSGQLRMATGTVLLSAGTNLSLDNSILIQTGGNATVNSGAGAGSTFKLNGLISGGRLDKLGDGTLVLASADSNYIGGTNLNFGTISVTASSTVTAGVIERGPLGTGLLTFANPTTLNAGATNLTIANAIAINSVGTVNVDTVASNFTLSGVIANGSGAGQLVKTGDGKLTLTNANTYSGTTALQAGTIAVANNAALGTGALVMTSLTTLQSGAANIDIGNAITTLGTSNIDTNGNAFMLSGKMSGAGNLTKIGVGTLTLTNATSDYTGGTALNFGTIAVTVGSTPTTGTPTSGPLGTGILTMADNTILKSAGVGLALANGIAISAGNIGIIDTDDNLFTLNGQITGANAKLSKVGTGTLVLSNTTSNYSGGTDLTQGTIRVMSSSSGPAGAPTSGPLGTASLNMTNGTVLQSGAANLTIGNNVAIASGGIGTVDTQANFFAVTGLISGNTLAKEGTGTLVLANGSSNYTGGTNLNNGTIAVTVSSTGPAGAPTSGPLGTGTLNMKSGTTLQAALTNVSIANNIAIAPLGSANVDSNTVGMTLSGLISGGTLTKIGAGTVTLTNGASNYSGGTKITQGTVAFTVGSTPTTGTVVTGPFGSGTITMDNGTSIQAAANNLSLANAIVVSPGAIGTIDTQANNFTQNGVINGNTLAKIGSGKLTITNAANGYTGGTNLDVGTIAITVSSIPQVLGSPLISGPLGTGTLNFANNTTLLADNADLALANNVFIRAGAIGTVDTQTNTFTLNGQITGPTGTLRKTGAGILNLTNGTSTYGGGTNLDVGIINITAGSTPTSGVPTSGVLGTGTVNMANLTELRAGAADLQLANAFTLAGTSTINTQAFNFGLNGAISGTGNLTKIGSGKLTLTNGTSTYSGGTFLNAGTIAVTASSTPLSGSPVTQGPLGTNTFNMATGTTLQSAAADLQIANNVAITGNGIVDTQANVFWLNGQITGGSLTKIGLGGTLVLTNGTSNYSGGTFLNEGTIRVGASSTPIAGAPVTSGPLGTGSLTMVGGTTLQSGGADFKLANDVVTLANGLVDARAAEILTLNGVVSGAGSISQVGLGILVLNNNANAFTNLGVNQGTVRIGGDTGGTNNAAGIGGITINNNATLQTGGAKVTLGNGVVTTANGLIDAQEFQTLILDGQVGGAGSISQVGKGLLVLNNTKNAFTNLGINQGTVRIGGDTTGANTAAGIGGIAINNNATLQTGGAKVTLANGVITTANGLIDAQEFQTLILDGQVGGAGSISQVGKGLLVLNNTKNAFTNLGINQGTVRIGGDTTGANTAAGIGGIAINNNATLQTGGAKVTLANGVITTANGLIDAQEFQTLILDGQIGGAGSISQVGKGLLVLNNTKNAFTNLGINQGTVRIGGDTTGANTAAGIGGIAINNNATLQTGGAKVTLANGVITTANGLIDAQEFQTLILDGQVGGAGSISQVGKGLLVLNNTKNAFTNLGINQGTVRIGGDTTGANTAAGIGGIAINNNATLQTGGAKVTLANGVITTANGLIDAQEFQTLILDGQIGGAGSISQVGKGLLVLNNTKNAFTNLGINQGTVRIGGDTTGANTAAGIGGIAINNNATLQTGGAKVTLANGVITTGNGLIDAQAGHTLILNGQVGGAGSISQVGLGTLVLNGNNSFNNLGINQGTVVVGTNTAAGVGLIALNNNATLRADAVSGTTVTLANRLTTTGNGLVDVVTGETLTLNGQVDGAGSISMIGLGTLVLNGNNSFNNLGINQGTVVVGTNTAAGAGLIALNNNATLRADAVSGTTVTLANRLTTTGNGLVDVVTGETLTLNGQVDGAGSISMIGLGTLVLNGNNSFNNLGINQGTVRVGSNTAAGIGGIAINNNTTLQSGGAAVTLANGVVTTGNGLIDAQEFQTLILDGQVGGAGSISQVGKGLLVLNNTKNAFTNLGINQGTVRIGGDTTGANTAAGIGGIAINNNATLQTGGAKVTLANGVITTANGLIDAQEFQTLILDGQIGGAGSISQVGKGLLVLNNTKNAFTNLGINQGTVRIGGDTTGANTAAGIGGIAINNNATLQTGGAKVTLANGVITTGNGLIDAQAGHTLILNGQVGGAGSISQVGLGTLVLNGNNSFNNLGINQGTVVVGTNTAAGVGLIALNNNATLRADAVSGTTVTLANRLTTTGNGLVDVVTGETLTLNGQVDGAGSISMIGLGTLVLNGNNSFNNLGINQGTVVVGTNTAAGVGLIALNNNATLRADAVSGTTVTLANRLTTTGNGLVDVVTGETLTLNGQVDGAGSISMIGLGTLVLNGNNSFNNLGINQGTVVVGTNTAAGAGLIALNNNATLRGDAVSGTTVTLANRLTTTGNGLVDVVTGETLTLNGQVDGAGSISMIGLGTLVLNGNNSFNNLGINQGTVRVGSNTAAGIGGIAINNNAILQSGAASVTLANGIITTANGFIDVRSGEVLTLTGQIGGAGTITKTGSGTLNLGSVNLFTGGLTIGGGTIGISNPASLGSGILTLNNGTLLTNANMTIANNIALAGPGTIDTAANTVTASGVISGSGRFTKAGTGSLTLTGVNTFTGGTTIMAGTLTGNVASLGSGGILNNGALVINQATDASFTQILSGTGSLTKSGAGALTMTAVSTMSGPTTVTAGRYIVTGSLANSALTMQSGTTLLGTGTVGALTVQSGATVAPGLSVGTLTVNGALNLAAGSTYAAEITPAAADRITASGAATIAGNLALTTSGTYTQFNASYTLVSGSTRTGNFASVTGLNSFGAAFAPTIVYDGTSAILRLAPASLVSQGGSALGYNQAQVASAFDRAVAAGYNPQAFFALYNQGSNLPVALSQLSGEVHSAERRVLLEDTRVVREAAFDRLNAGLSALSGQAVSSTSGDKTMTAWLRAAGSWGTASADGVGQRFTTEQTGFLTGFDYATNGFKVGGLFHYTHNDVRMDSLGTSKLESIGGAVYAGWRQADSGFAVGAGGGIASNKAKASRGITAPGLGQSLSSQVDGTTYQAFGEIAFDLAKSGDTRIEPFARVAYSQVDSGDLTEVGGNAAVVAAKQKNDITQMTFGLRGAYTVGSTTLMGSAGWLRTTGDRSAPTILGITGMGTTSNIQSVALDKDAVALEAQARFSLSGTISLGIGYSGVIGSNNNDHGARATLTIGF